MKKNINYQLSDPSLWQGRIHDTNNCESFRWHQVIEFLDHTTVNTGTVSDRFCFLGYCCVAVVKQNKGRTGAAKGPSCIPREMANIPCYFS